MDSNHSRLLKFGPRLFKAETIADVVQIPTEWNYHVCALAVQLERLMDTKGITFEAVQIKSKFNRLRVYLSINDEDAEQLITDMENKIDKDFFPANSGMLYRPD